MKISANSLTSLAFFLILLIASCSSDDTSQNLSIIASSTEPSIVSFSPTSGPVGTTIIIEGSNFNGSGQSVSIGDTEVVVISTTDTKIEAVVVTETITDKITVTVNGKSTSSKNKFTVLP